MPPLSGLDPLISRLREIDGWRPRDADGWRCLVREGTLLVCRFAALSTGSSIIAGSVDGGSDSSTTIGSGCVSGIISRFAGLPLRVVVVAAACPKFDDALMTSGSGWVSGISCLIVRGLPRRPRGF